MAANTNPIFPLTPKVTWINCPAPAANTTTDLTSGTIFNSGYTAGTNGSRIDFVKARSLGTNVNTVLRIWINNGSTTATAANNTLYMERTLGITTVSQTAEQPDLAVALNLSLPVGYILYFTFGTTVAAGYDLVTVGGDY
jgi:hypothetical protein